MLLKYFIFILYAVCLDVISTFEFKNLQIIEYDERSSSYFGDIDLHKFKKIGKKYFWIQTDVMVEWWEAYYTCRKQNSFLATLSLEDMDNLAPYLTEKGADEKYWVGGTDLQREGQFRWSENGENVPRGNMWLPGEPSDSAGHENCMNMFRNGEDNKFRLNDAPCNYASFFICARDSPKAVTFVAW